MKKATSTIREYKGWKIRRDHARKWYILGAPCAPTSTPTLRQAKALIDKHVAAGKVPPQAFAVRPVKCRHGVSPACDECRAELKSLQGRLGKLLKGEFA